MSAELEASTVTPGSVAPEASVTVPVICACAEASEGTKTNSASIARVRADLLISAPPGPAMSFSSGIARLVAHTMAARPQPVNSNSGYNRHEYPLLRLLSRRGHAKLSGTRAAARAPAPAGCFEGR